MTGPSGGRAAGNRANRARSPHSALRSGHTSLVEGTATLGAEGSPRQVCDGPSREVDGTPTGIGALTDRDGGVIPRRAAPAAAERRRRDRIVPANG